MGYENDNAYPLVDPPFELKDFSGGYVDTDSGMNLADNETPLCCDVFCKGADQPLQKMFGNSAINATIGASTVFRGLFDYQVEATGNQYLMAAAGTKIYDNSGAAWNDVTGTASITSDAQVFGWTFNGRFIGITDQRDAPFKRDDAANCAALGGSPPAGKCGCKWNNYNVIANTAAQPNFAYHSDPGYSDAGWTNYWSVRSDRSAGLTACGAIDKILYLWHAEGGDRIQERGGTSFSHDQNYLNVGVVAQATVQSCNVKIGGRLVKMLIGMGQSGVYGFDGSQNPYLLSEKIKNKWDPYRPNSINRAYQHRSVAAYDPINRWYILSIPTGSSTSNNETWILDLDTMAWWPAVPQAIGAILVRTENSTPTILTGGYEGIAYRWSRVATSYAGAAINAYWNSKVFDFKKTVRCKAPIPYAKASGAYNLDFLLKWEFGSGIADSLLMDGGGSLYGTGTYGTSTYGSSTPIVYAALDALNYTGQHLQVQLGNNRVGETFQLNKIVIPARVIGRRPCRYR